MKQRQSMGGVGLLILMLLVIMFFSLKVPGMATERELSYPEFMVYLENKTVESAQIRPNREVRKLQAGFDGDGTGTETDVPEDAAAVQFQCLQGEQVSRDSPE